MLPLLPYLPPQCQYIEPCAGDGRLIRHLSKHGHECIYACDIDPENDEHNPLHIDEKDVLFFDPQLPQCDMIITNPPWERALMHDMIEVFRKHAPTWLLFDSDWMFTAQAQPYKPYCAMIVTVGRVSWADNGVSGMDNCCWYLFTDQETETIFI